MRLTKLLLLILFYGFTLAFADSSDSETGILILAHGGKTQWNDHVKSIVSEVDQVHPTEVAFGMANKQQIESALQRLVDRNAKHVVAIPLFVSSHSSVIRSTEYLLGVRKEKPPEVEIFAKMDHSHHGATHEASANPGPVTPISVTVPLMITSALNDHPLVAEILLDRARSISKNSDSETLIVVAHGPVSEEDNELWLKDMNELANKITSKGKFHDVQTLTVRDDAPPEIRDQATQQLRDLVESAEGKTVLVVPLLLSYGGIEDGIRKRLDGLDYVMAEQGLLPDKRITNWIYSQVDQSKAELLEKQNPQSAKKTTNR